VVDRLPAAARPASGSAADLVGALREFCLAALAAVAPHVPAVKLQSACFERYRAPGVALLFELIAEAARRDLVVILDQKRGDIGTSAAHYAAAAFGPAASDDAAPDWITINSYLGADGMRPFLCSGRGAFALVRTSNPGGDAVQDLRLDDGRTVSQAVADLVASVGSETVGIRGYSNLGAVVGATRPEAAAALRARMPQQILLVPGFGAQGGTIDDVLPCFRPDGAGAVVTASRSVLYAFKADDPGWATAVGDAAAALAEQVGRATGWR
jgi:orotidine-5'-phosphate decarboxylase